MKARSGPLENIRVLDLSRIMAGPWATQILADLGADVIKVERAGRGDDTREWGPPYLKGEADGDARQSGYFLSVNRGKRSVEIDLKTESGRDVIRALAAKSDILVENFKFGDLARIGLDYESLKEINERLIYVSITGFGQTGPKRQGAAYDFAIQAMGGLMSVTGEADGRSGGGPQKVGVPIVDIMTGMYATIGALAALSRRAETGQGDYVDIAMLDVQVAFLANQAQNWLVSGKEPVRRGNRHPNIQPQDVFPCEDGNLVLAVGNDQQFQSLSESLQKGWATDPRFTTNAKRVENEAALGAEITAAFSVRRRDDLIRLLSAAGVPCSPINSVSEVFADEQVVHREMLKKIHHPLLGHIPQVVSPLNFARERLSFERPPPLLGEHTNEVLEELGIWEIPDE